VNGVILASESLDCADMYFASRFLSIDPFVYIEAGGRRYLTVYWQDVARAKATSEADEVWDQDELLAETGQEDVSVDGWLPAVGVAAARRVGLVSAIVPDWFPVACADALRAHGVTVTVDGMVVRSRRRTKSAADVAAIEQALRAIEAGLDLIRERLRGAAVAADGVLRCDGRPLTSEQLHAEVRALFAAHRCEGPLLFIAGGPQGADVYEVGHGPLRAGEPIVCDLFPRHSDTRFFGDMTRVFCAGLPPSELVRAHDAVRRANELGRSLVRPGVRGREVFEAVAEMFHREGYGTPLRDDAGGRDEGLHFPAWLGHGLGLDVHETEIGLDPDHVEPLREGDVVTVEPELYRRGWGCVRLEDVVLVTADGCRTLSRFDYELI
jgi:Xaa-Pro aminopeptidase